MTPARQVIEPESWDSITLVAFDVDGTLYRQRLLHLQISREILRHVLSKLNFDIIKVLTAFRSIRERLSEEEVPDFEHVLIAETAAATAQPPDVVRHIVAEWIEQRPLRYLADCRYPKLPELFEGLRRKGKIIGVLSDYPATAKLSVLGLRADHVVCAGDQGIKLLKPHPRGLEFLIAAAGAEPHSTVLIGDRVERDGFVARRAGVRALIRSSRAILGWQTFARFDDAVFAPFLTY